MGCTESEQTVQILILGLGFHTGPVPVQNAISAFHGENSLT